MGDLTRAQVGGGPAGGAHLALFTGYAASLPDEELGASGVLAVVAAALYLSLQSPRMTSPRNRLQVFDVLEVVNFLLTSLLFILVGLQLPSIFGALSDRSPATLVLYVTLVSLAVIGTCLLWTFPMFYLPRLLSRRLRERDPSPPRQQVAVVAYSSSRGAVSLAIALSPPNSRELVSVLGYDRNGTVPRGRTYHLPHLLRNPGHPGAADPGTTTLAGPIPRSEGRQLREAREDRGATASGGGHA